MKKCFLIISLALLTGACSHSYNAMLPTGINLNLEGNGRYQLLGDTEGYAQVSRVLFFYFGVDAGLSANFPADRLLWGGGRQVCEQAAAYKAIDSFEGADQIICPRFKTDLQINLWPLYQKWTTSVKAKAVRITQ